MRNKALSEEGMEGTTGWRGNQRGHLLCVLVVNKTQGQSVHGQRGGGGGGTKEAADRVTLKEPSGTCHRAGWNMHGLTGSLMFQMRHSVHERTFCPVMSTRLRLIGAVTWGLMKCQHHQSVGSQVCVWGSNKAASWWKSLIPLSH